MRQLLISTGFVFGFAALGLTAGDGNAKTSDTITPDIRSVLYSEYMECHDASVVRVLSPGEVAHCSHVYVRLKLSFIEGVTVEDFAALTPAERAEVNKAAYIAFRSWADARPQSLN